MVVEQVLTDKKNAASYLASRFQEIGLLPLSEASYFQHFHYNINTFPGKLSLQTDQTLLKPGHDFIVEASSPSGKGTFKLVVLEYTSLFLQKN